jgi:hypothetical protein
LRELVINLISLYNINVAALVFVWHFEEISSRWRGVGSR